MNKPQRANVPMPEAGRNGPIRIAVIGGGLSGLASALRLQELVAKSEASVQIELFEESNRLGGIVGTERIGEYLVDTGADSWITNRPGAIGLCRKLGIEHRLQGLSTAVGGALILLNGHPQPAPEGFALLRPSELWPMWRTPLISWRAKIRMLFELCVPRRKVAGGTRDVAGHLGDFDESLASFVRRRFGGEMLDRIVQPLVGGIYTSDPEKLSLAATMPRFIEQEQRYGSLLRAAWAERKVNSEAEGRTSGARYGLFAALPGGMGELVEACRAKLHDSIRVHLQTRIDRIRRTASGFELYHGRTAPEQYDAVILGLAAYHAAVLLSEFDSDLATELHSIDYASSAIVVSGHSEADIQHPLDAYGLVIPHREKRQILAVSFASRKFPDRAPSGKVQLRTFLGGAMQPELMELTDEALCAVAQRELADILGVRGAPDFVRIVRYIRAMPQYEVGHVARTARITQCLHRYPTLALASNYLYGVGVPDTITSGENAAERVWAGLSKISESD